MNILLIDDDADDRMIFVEALRHVNPEIRCQTAQDGLEAQSALANPDYLSKLTYIFLDLRLPGIDGLTLLRIMRTDRRLSRIPVCIYATGDDPADIRQITQLGAKYLKKHDDFDECVNDLRTLLRDYVMQERNQA